VLDIEVRDFDTEAAYAAGELRRITQGGALSLGDRACLALAMRLGATAVTADRAWAAFAGRHCTSN
jgi:PIN domain nuclease of toxin-antitoxin system